MKMTEIRELSEKDLKEKIDFSSSGTFQSPFSACNRTA